MLLLELLVLNLPQMLLLKPRFMLATELLGLRNELLTCCRELLLHGEHALLIRHRLSHRHAACVERRRRLMLLLH